MSSTVAEIASGIGDDLLQQAACVLQAVENAREFAAQAVVGADEGLDRPRRAFVDGGAHGLGRLRIHRGELVRPLLERSQHGVAAILEEIEHRRLRSCRASTT